MILRASEFMYFLFTICETEMKFIKNQEPLSVRSYNSDGVASILSNFSGLIKHRQFYKELKHTVCITELYFWP